MLLSWLLPLLKSPLFLVIFLELVVRKCVIFSPRARTSFWDEMSWFLLLSVLTLREANKLIKYYPLFSRSCYPIYTSWFPNLHLLLKKSSAHCTHSQNFCFEMQNVLLSEKNQGRCCFTYARNKMDYFSLCCCPDSFSETSFQLQLMDFCIMWSLWHF